MSIARSPSSKEVVGLDRLAAGAPLTSQVALAIRPHDTERESRLLHVSTPAVLHAEKVSDLMHERRCNHCWTAVSVLHDYDSAALAVCAAY